MMGQNLEENTVYIGIWKQINTRQCASALEALKLQENEGKLTRADYINLLCTYSRTHAMTNQEIYEERDKAEPTLYEKKYRPNFNSDDSQGGLLNHLLAQIKSSKKKLSKEEEISVLNTILGLSQEGKSLAAKANE